MKAFLQPLNIAPAQHEALTELARGCLAACRTQAADGTVIFRPDGSGNYDALWTRDFCYTVEGLGPLMEPSEILGAIDYLLAGQREDGVIPDRRRPDGLSVYLAGPVDKPLGQEPPTDNAQFMVKAVAAYVKLTGDVRAFLQRRNALYRAVESVPLSEDQLVSVDPNRPHAGYGFTDCIAKTGNELFSSLLYWEACGRLAKLCARSEVHDEAHEWYERAEHCSRRIQDFWDERWGMYQAASNWGRQVDLWGSAYACVVRVATKTMARRVADYFLADLQVAGRDKSRPYDGAILHGHLRHLPPGEHWHRLLADVPPGTYQNGGFWAVPSGWLIQTVALADEAIARELVGELVAEFQAHGVCEWISPERHVLPGYVASIANVLAAVQPSKKLA